MDSDEELLSSVTAAPNKRPLKRLKKTVERTVVAPQRSAQRPVPRPTHAERPETSAAPAPPSSRSSTAERKLEERVTRHRMCLTTTFASDRLCVRVAIWNSKQEQGILHAAGFGRYKMRAPHAHAMCHVEMRGEPPIVSWVESGILAMQRLGEKLVLTQRVFLDAATWQVMREALKKESFHFADGHFRRFAKGASPSWLSRIGRAALHAEQSLVDRAHAREEEEAREREEQDEREWELLQRSVERRIGFLVDHHGIHSDHFTAEELRVLKTVLCEHGHWQANSADVNWQAVCKRMKETSPDLVSDLRTFFEVKARAEMQRFVRQPA